ncbi:MFS general substrate transporter [Flammula alnicola]|nr:MFS general substrate transporter [Flammula alnicola]
MAKVETIVFLSLVLDLFAFTIPLPLFPRLIQWYTLRESSDPNGFLSRTLQFVTSIRTLLYKPGVQSQRWDVVLLGGLMGSVFSTLQFFVSPRIGTLSDKYGRKRVLLITMIGNILSALMYLDTVHNICILHASRVVGGLSEGNVQLAIAILSDVTTPATRSKALAHVGIAFAICFCIGPPIGAYFASRPIPRSADSWGPELNVYAAPAILTLVLLVAETAFLAVALPETRGKGIPASSEKKKAASHTNGNGKHTDGPPNYQAHHRESYKPSPGTPEITLLLPGLILWSGIHLTFLTFDLLDWSNTQNGKLIGSIGIISALLQGGYVRRSISKVGEGNMARRGVSSCAVALVLLAILPKYVQTQPSLAMKLLQAAAVCMAFTSATVVNSLTAFASLQCDEGHVDETTGKVTEEHPQLAKGKALGEFRSSGQLGRALGPLLACASYWTFGPSVTYGASALAMMALSVSMKRIAKTKST